VYPKLRTLADSFLDVSLPSPSGTLNGSKAWERKEREEREVRAEEREQEKKKKKKKGETPPAWGPTAGRKKRPRKTPGLSQKGQGGGWASVWDLDSTKKAGPSSLHVAITSPISGGIFGGAGTFGDFSAIGKSDSPGSAEEFRIPLTKGSKKGIDDFSNLDLGRLDIFENPNLDIAVSRFNRGDLTYSSGVGGEASGGGGNTGSIAMPTLVGDRRSIFTDTAPDRKRETQRENLVEGFLGPNTAGPENIPESAAKIKHVPAPGGFDSSVIYKREKTGDTQDDGWGGWEEIKAGGSQKNFKVPSPVEEKALETQAEETEEPVRTEETATPAEEDEFHWTATKKRKKGQVASVARTASEPSTTDPDDVEDGAG
jgi:hypothetical protein